MIGYPFRCESLDRTVKTLPEPYPDYSSDFLRIGNSFPSVEVVTGSVRYAVGQPMGAYSS